MQLAHCLELTVVGEGVGTPEQLQFLRTNGCDLAQGFHVSAPLPADELETWMARRLRAVA